jgi:hypothetical protein
MQDLLDIIASILKENLVKFNSFFLSRSLKFLRKVKSQEGKGENLRLNCKKQTYGWIITL